MAHAGQELEGPNGFRLRLVEIDPELLVMEARYAGEGGLPPEHLHPSQEERFEVQDGAVRTVIAGDEKRYAQGESFTVPAGTPHQMAGDGPATVRWEVRPALRTPEFFERLYGEILTGQGEWDAFAAEFAAEFRLT